VSVVYDAMLRMRPGRASIIKLGRVYTLFPPTKSIAKSIAIIVYIGHKVLGDDQPAVQERTATILGLLVWA